MAISQAPLEIRTVSVEKVLEPLISQLSVLIERNEITERPKGLSRNKDLILDSLKKSVTNFIRCGEEIMRECPDVKENLQVALTDIRETGRRFYKSVSGLLDNPVNDEIQATMSRVARSLLSSVTRLFILADLVDVQRLYNCLESIKGDIECIGIINDEQEFFHLFATLEAHMDQLNTMLKPRCQELLDSIQQEDLTAAHFNLNLGCKMTITSTKASLRFPDLATIDANRRFAVQLSCAAVDRLCCACDASYSPEVLPPLKGLAVARVMEDILSAVRTGTEHMVSWNSALFQNSVDKLSSEVSALTDSAGFGNSFQSDISHCFNNLREAVRRFIEAREFETTSRLQRYAAPIEVACASIRSSIAQASLILCSPAFSSNDIVLNHLEEYAKSSNESALMSVVEDLQQQTSDLIDAALCICGLSTDPNEVCSIRQTAIDLEYVTPQLINASKALALRNQSVVTQENFQPFIDAYKSLNQRLRAKIDGLTNVTDLLEVNSQLLQEDIKNCEAAADAGQVSEVMGVSRTVNARMSRLNSFVSAKLDGQLPTDVNTSDSIRAALQDIQEKLMPQFTEAARELCRQVRSPRRASIPGLEGLRQSAEAIQETLIEIRTILVGRSGREFAASETVEETRSLSNTIPPTPPPMAPPGPADINDPISLSSPKQLRQRTRSTHSSSSMSGVPIADHESLSNNIAQFNAERASFLRQVIRRKHNKVYEGIITLSWEICVQLTDMIDYTDKGSGGKICDDHALIQAARQISHLGAQLNGACEKVAQGCPESKTKRDLLVSLKNINLFSHQLAITSRVKADMAGISGELGLDNSHSLVESSRNLLSAVISAVKETHALNSLIPNERAQSSRSLPPIVPRRRSARPHAAGGGRRLETAANDTASSESISIRVDRSFDFSY